MQKTIDFLKLKNVFYPTKEKIIVFIVLTLVAYFISYLFFVNAFSDITVLMHKSFYPELARENPELFAIEHPIELYSYLALNPDILIFFLTGSNIIIPTLLDLILKLLYYYVVSVLIILLIRRTGLLKS